MVIDRDTLSAQRRLHRVMKELAQVRHGQQLVVPGPPAHAPQPGSAPMREYVDELEREATLRERPGGPR